MAKERKIERLAREVQEQRAWIERCGGSLAGYINHYGDPGIPPLNDEGKPKTITVKPQEVCLFEGRLEPVPDRPCCFFANHYGNGGTAIFEADHNRLVALEADYERVRRQEPLGRRWR
jgi:hypothetical protein